MKANYRPYMSGDLEYIVPHPAFDGDTGSLERTRHAIGSGMPTWTILDPSGRPVAIVGFAMIFTSVAQIFGYIDVRVKDNPKNYLASASTPLLLSPLESDRIKKAAHSR